MIEEIDIFASWRVGARFLRRQTLCAASAVGLGTLFLLLAMAAGVAAKEVGDHVQAELDRVAKMSVAQQQAWLQQLEQRAARAARLTLSPKEAARQEARTSAMLHQKTVTWKVLREVIEDTERREKAAAAVAKVKAAKKASVAKPQAARIAKPQAVKGGAAAVRVNVEELEARIAAVNLALRGLEAELAENTPWTAARLEPLADRLKGLVVRYRDLGLFRDALSKEEQADVTKLETPKSAIAELAAHVAEARKRANGPQFVGDEVERRAELTRLQVISHELAKLAGK